MAKRTADRPQPPSIEPAPLSAREAAERLGVDARTVRRAIRRGDLVATKVGGAFRIAPDKIERFREAASARRAPRSGSRRSPAAPAAPVALVPERDRPLPPLPRPPTSFVGRERELAALAGLLGDPAARLVTLTGPGGVGKTRLALRAADAAGSRFAGGVGFVSLAAVRAPDLVLPTIARALGAPEGNRSDPHDRLVSALRGRQALLVLDNLEQVAECGAALVDLLAACPDLALLVTSRAPLRVSGERLFAVPPLALPKRPPLPDRARPPAAPELAEVEAVRLFVDRARAAAADFALTEENAETVAAICARLGGLPLAIELAAARVAILPPAELHARLSRQLPLLTGGPRDQPPRLRSMRHAIAWSHDLVGEPARRLFRRLAVFAGGFTLEAAEAVGGGRVEEDESGVTSHESRVTSRGGDENADSSTARLLDSSTSLDLLAELVDAGLLRRTAQDAATPRFAMLEPVREFALERLAASGEADAAHLRLTEWLLARAEFEGWRWAVILGPTETAWFADWEREIDNLRAALGWAEARARADLLLRLAGTLFLFWWRGAHLAEGRHWLERGLALPGPIDPPIRALALSVLSALAHRQDDNEAAAELALRAAAISRDIGDGLGAALAEYLLAIARYRQGDLAAAGELYAVAAAALRASGNPILAAEALVGLAQVERDQGRLDHAISCYREALGHQTEAGIAWGASLSRYGLATVLQARGQLARARAHYRESLAYWRAIGDWGSVAVCLEGIASACCAGGDAERAARLFAAAQAVREVSGSPIPCRAQAAYGAAFATVRARLGREAFDDAWRAGWRLSLDEAIAEATLRGPRGRAATAPVRQQERHGLTRREQEVLRLVAEGRSDREIAEALSISTRTASDHVGHILRKLDARSRADAAAFAVRHGLA